MPKMKSHSGAKKRFRVTANGRVKRNRVKTTVSTKNRESAL